MIRILIVEDHPDVCDALVSAFASTPDLHVMGVAKGPECAVSLRPFARPIPVPT